MSANLDTILKSGYGYRPSMQAPMTTRVLDTENICCGHAKNEKIEITIEGDKGTYSFPFNLSYPVTDKKVPVFVFLNFRSMIFDRYCPLEEVIDRGYAVASIYYNDVSTDNNESFDKLGEVFTRPEDGTGFGKIALWSYAASRVIDYLYTREEIDLDNIAVIGHSRLGKTALLTGACDERIKYTVSNDSGCMGAALNRTKHENAETYERIASVFPLWFCDNFNKASVTNDAPFDADDLLDAICPRYVIVGSATGDAWADPSSEENSCIEAGKRREARGLVGYIDEKTTKGYVTQAFKGSIGYSLRDGGHFLSRHDWNSYMDFIDLKK